MENLGEQINFLDCDRNWKVPKIKKIKKESGNYRSFGFPGIPVILNSKDTLEIPFFINIYLYLPPEDFSQPWLLLYLQPGEECSG